MLTMTEKTKEFLMQNLPAAMDVSDVNDALDMIYDWIDLNGFRADGLYNAKGMAAQAAYDDLFMSND